MPFDDEDEDAAGANESDFGLHSSDSTADRDRALRIAKRLDAGYTYLDGLGPLAQDGRAPFGAAALAETWAPGIVFIDRRDRAIYKWHGAGGAW